MKLRCRFGLHKYIEREIHVVEIVKKNKWPMAEVAERCECGHAKFVGRAIPTKWVIPTKYRN